MENSTLAILIAGGILIAMITISIFYFTFGLTSDFMGNTGTNYGEKELAAFNKRFEAFDKDLMYGSDLISVYNLINESNENYRDYAGFTGVTMNISGANISIETAANEVRNVPITQVGNSISRNGEVDTFLSSIFHCTDITYNSAGWVTSISFASGKK